jgi:hypothetical protein
MWNCLNCILFDKDKYYCKHFNLIIDQNNYVENCPYYHREITVCPNCGTQFVSNLALVYDIDESKWKCVQCRHQKGK